MVKWIERFWVVSDCGVVLLPIEQKLLPFTDFIYKLKFSSDDNYVNFYLKTHVIRLENLFGIGFFSRLETIYKMLIGINGCCFHSTRFSDRKEEC